MGNFSESELNFFEKQVEAMNKRRRGIKTLIFVLVPVLFILGIVGSSTENTILTIIGFGGFAAFGLVMVVMAITIRSKRRKALRNLDTEADAIIIKVWSGLVGDNRGWGGQIRHTMLVAVKNVNRLIQCEVYDTSIQRFNFQRHMEIRIKYYSNNPSHGQVM